MCLDGERMRVVRAGEQVIFGKRSDGILSKQRNSAWLYNGKLVTSFFFGGYPIPICLRLVYSAL